jgi:hypothetical protein
MMSAGTFTTSRVSQIFHVGAIILGVVAALAAYYNNMQAAGAIAIVIAGWSALGAYLASPTAIPQMPTKS